MDYQRSINVTVSAKIVTDFFSYRIQHKRYYIKKCGIPIYKQLIHNICILSTICTILCSAFLGNIKDAFDKNSDLSNLLLDSFFKKAIDDAQVRLLGRWLVYLFKMDLRDDLLAAMDYWLCGSVFS